MAACDLDGAAAHETVRLLGGPVIEAQAPRGNHAAFQADVSETTAARRLLEQVQVNAWQPSSCTSSHIAPISPALCGVLVWNHPSFP